MLTRRLNPARRGRRGYLLLEVMIGGALAASVIATLYVSWINSKRQIDIAARDAIAAQLVSQRIEEVSGAGYTLTIGTAPTQTFNASEAVPGLTLPYTRTTAETNTGTSFTPAVNWRDITVTVTYVQHAMIKDRAATIRVWQ